MSGGITKSIDLGYACFQGKYYRVCIEQLKDSHAEDVQFATAAVSTPFRT